MSAVVEMKKGKQPDVQHFAEPEAAPRVPWIMSFSVMFVIVAILTLVKWYQHTYSWSVGLDAFAPEFQKHWMTILYTEIIVIPVLGAVGAAWLWFSRDRDINNLPATEELKRYYQMLGVLSASSLVIVATLGLLTEADAAWHQVVIRDTDFTPTHIFLFYLGLPAAFGGLIMAWLYVHTRFPYFANRVSLPLSLAILGFMMAAPVVAFNEWGHTFFYAEELFAAPVHWFFVLAGYFLICLTGFVLQCIQRIRQLTEKLSLDELEKAMLA
jgi:methane/ammonia monooxygenase subunit C